MSNDAEIKKYRDAVEAKREELGERPKLAYKTNALLVWNGQKVNLNTLNSVEDCVRIVAQLLSFRESMTTACQFLGTEVKAAVGDYEILTWVEDIRSRVKLLAWEAGKKKLTAMDKQLAGLRSDDAKTSDAIADIAAQLKE